jgi:hypothetical protein
MVMMGLGLAINFGWIHFGWAAITGDWADLKENMGAILILSIIVSFGVLLA